MKLKLLILSMLFSALTWGQSIFTNPLTFPSAVQASPYTAGQTTDPNITVSGIARGSGIAGTAALNRYAASGWDAGALDVNDYFEFTLTPNAGFEIDYVSFVYTGQASGTGPTSFAFRSSLDGFASNIGTPIATGATISLAAGTYQNIVTSVTYRIYGWGASAAAGTFSINDFTFNGVVAATCYPSTQASALVISNPTLDGFNVSWTAGNGNGTMIVIRLNASPNAVPVTGTPYTPNLAWGSAGQIDVNNRVVFRGLGTSAGPITELTAGEEYRITAYEYNTAGNCYNLISPATTVGYTLSVEPTAHAASLSCTAVSDTQIDLTFPARSTIPNARAYVILRKIGSVPTGVPTDGNFYAPATVIGDATVVGTTALDGAETSYSVTGLTPGTNYYFTIIPFNAYLSVPSTMNYRTSATIPSTNCTTNTACYLADFEAPATKGAYPSGDVTLGAYVWNMSECLIGTSASDYKTGLQSARMRANANAALEMQQDKTSGVSTISFNYRQFGTDTSQANFKVEYSKDAGNSWIQIGPEFTATATPQTFFQTLNQVGAVRVRVVYSSGPLDNNQRVNIDQFQLCDYTDVREMEVFGNSTTIQDGSLTYTTLNDTDYGDDFFVGDAPIVKTYTITNRGTGTLNLSSLTLTGDTSFSISSGLSSASLASGASATFGITFNALTTGTKTTLVTIGNDDSDENPYTFTLRALSNNYIKCALNAKQTIAQQDFEVAPAAPVLTYTNVGGSAAGGTNYGDNRAATTNMFIGARSFQGSNGTHTIEFASTDVSNYKNIEFTFNIGGYSSAAAGGMETSDVVKVYVSEDNGTTWIPQLQITGFNNAIFDINTAPAATINHTYNSSLLAGARYATADNSTNTFTKTFVIKQLPNVAQLKFKMELKSSDVNEIWVIDNVKLEGQLPQSTTWDGATWSAGVPVPTKKAIFAGDYNTSIGDIEACECEINATRTLTVSPNDYLEIQSDLKNSGNIVVQHQGSLINVNDDASITNTGTMAVQKTTATYERYDYTYWSSPTANTTIGSVLGAWRNDYTFWFNTANFIDVDNDDFDDNHNDWIGVAQADVMDAGKGYISMAPTTGSFPTTANVTFSGKVNNGVITKSIVLSPDVDTDDDFNLVGNPYPSAIFADDFINLNPDISGTLYFWTHVGNISIANPGPDLLNFTSDDYAVYNLTGGTRAAINTNASSGSAGVPTGYIASGQGFLVEADVVGSVTFQNSLRRKTYANNDFFRQVQPDGPAKDRIWISMRNDIGMYSQLLVGYFNQASPGYDRGYDGLRQKGMAYIHFYSFINNDAGEYKIQGRSPFDAEDVVPLGYRANYAGEYKITIDNTEGVLDSENVHVYIEDKLLNVIHDLKQSDYVFNTTVGIFNDRFVLRYTSQTLGNDDFDLTEKNVLIYPSNNEIKIDSPLLNIKDYVVYDVLGRKLALKNNVNTKQSSVNSITKNNQTLIVKVTLENGQNITKKIIF